MDNGELVCMMEQPDQEVAKKYEHLKILLLICHTEYDLFSLLQLV